MNPGLLDEKHENYLCAVVPPVVRTTYSRSLTLKNVVGCYAKKINAEATIFHFSKRYYDQEYVQEGALCSATCS